MNDDFGQPLKHVTPGAKFAVKCIKFSRINSIEEMTDIQYAQRLKIEDEKYISTHVNHPNIVTTRVVIFVGQLTEIPYRDPERQGEVFVSHERVYMFMDYANLGTLRSYLTNLITSGIRLTEGKCFSICSQLIDGKY